MCFLSLFHFLKKKKRSSSYLLLLSRSGSWSFLLEVAVGPSQLGLALPSQGWGWSFLFAPFFFSSFVNVSLIFDASWTISTTPTKDEGIQHNPKGKEGESQDLAKRGGGEGHQRKRWRRPGPEPKRRGEARP